MRSLLVDWIVEVNQDFNQKPETLFMTIYLLDSFIG